METEIIKQNLHTHSVYDDGKDTIDAMALEAIARGFTVLGWSGHGFNHPLDPGSMTQEGHEKYQRDIARAKKQYGDRLHLWCGIEQDSLSRLNPEAYEYVIGSVHFVPGKQQAVPVDYSEEEFERLLREDYDGDIQKLVRTYYAQITEMCSWPEVDIIGHIDLISKYNEEEKYFPFDAPWYVAEAMKAMDAGIAHNKIFEMNTGAIARGYRTTPYPHDLLLLYMADHGARLCINTDCHNKENLDLGIEDCLTRARKAGFTQLWTLQEEGFVPEDIEKFVG